MMPDNLIETFSNYITASMFGSPDTFIEFPKMDIEKYKKASEEEKSQLIEDTINNDPFWGKFFSKIKDKEAYIEMLELTKI